MTALELQCDDEASSFDVPSYVQSGPFSIGERIANAFLITAVLGKGGMGVVYEAADLNLPRRVALKAALSPAHERSLAIEAQALSAIRSPAFVTVHSVGVHARVPFFVMERIYGETLEARLQMLRATGERLRVADALAILGAIADGLAAAHKVGIAHRDLKPANVILSGERVVLIDLGLFVPDALRRGGKEVAGSPHWMAPEALLGAVAPGNGPLVDLYALGVIAYELLTGERPFDADDICGLLMAHVCGEIPAIASLRPDVPLAVAALVERLLAKEPEDRPSSAEAVLWQLHEAQGRAALRSARVLIVDQDPMILSAVRDALTRGSPQLVVKCTTNVERALPQDGQAPADIVVLDPHARADGPAICHALHALPLARRPHLIAMTHEARPEDIHLGDSVERFVPRDPKLLAHVIREVVSVTSAHS